MSSFERLLIESVRKQPALYDCKHKDYRRLDTKQQMWQEIAYRLQTSEARCRLRWKSLRDKYKRVRKNLGNESGQTARWKYYDFLRFLDDYHKLRPHNENITTVANTFPGQYLQTGSAAPTEYQLKRENIMKNELNQPFVSFNVNNELHVISTLQQDPTNPQAGLALNNSTTSEPLERCRRAAQECVSQQFSEFLNFSSKSSQSQGINVVNNNIQRTSTSKLFEVLAEKIDQAKLPENVLNKLEASMSKLVYDTLSQYIH